MRATDTGRPCLGHAALAMITAAVALTATACASAASSTSAAPPASSATVATTPRAAASPSESMAETAGTIGTDCGMIPAAGMGSMHAMAMDPVVTAASHNPLITTLAAEIKKAGLTATLDSASGITVFAPDNQAFAHDMSMLGGGTAELAKVLKYHVVAVRITPAELAHGMTLTTLEGSPLMTSKMGSVYEVNSADVTCGPLHTANATVYIINKVLIPMH